MKVIAKFAIAVSALTASHAALAATGSYSRSGAGPNVYAAGAENSTLFTSGGTAVPTTALISTVSYSAGSYSNGWTSQNVRVCYAPRYSATYTKCLDISANRVGSTNFFSGLDARGSFKITYILTGGTYPAVSGFTNSITVNYTY